MVVALGLSRSCAAGLILPGEAFAVSFTWDAIVSAGLAAGALKQSKMVNARLHTDLMSSTLSECRYNRQVYN